MRTRFQRLILLFALLGAFAFARAAGAQEWRATVPLGLPADVWTHHVPRSNPLTAAKVGLGRRLFFDARLSIDGRVSCATCHDPERGFADGRAVAEGVGGRRGTRNSPTLLNALFAAGQFWDGRAESLEEQAVQPLVNPLEMGNPSYDVVVARLAGIAEYEQGFKEAFGGGVTIERIAQALASFERTLVAGDSPFDRFIAGNQRAITDEARRGFALFRGKGRCARCHTFSELMPLFTDFAYHNTGVAAGHPAFESLARRAFAASERPGFKAVIETLAREKGGDELGRMIVTHQVFDLGSFKTPSLRNVALTAPYFHDGSAATLDDVVRFYNEGGRPNLNREWDLDPLDLSDAEQHDLIAFLKSLTGTIPGSADLKAGVRPGAGFHEPEFK